MSLVTLAVLPLHQCACVVLIWCSILDLLDQGCDVYGSIYNVLVSHLGTLMRLRRQRDNRSSR